MEAEAINIKNKALLRDQCYINGEWMEAKNGSSSEVTNPANSERLGSLPNCGTDETILAIMMAKIVSSVPQLGSDPSRSELAGLVTSDEEPFFASIHSPLI